MNINTEIPEPKLARLLFADTRFSWLWFIVRVYVGWEWLTAGWGKFNSAAWVGDQAGTALQGFLNGAVAKAVGEHPAVSSWYSSFLSNVAIPHASFFAHLVTYGEILVGIALILGVFTGIAAFFGAFMNLNFLFAGAVSSNPILAVLQLLLILAWRNAGWLGLDKWLLPKLGTPWHKGSALGSRS
jgi:thiosulfate dehydrogenase [quinone] large subunit